MRSSNRNDLKSKASGQHLWKPYYTDTNWWEIWQVIDKWVVFAKKSSFSCIPFHANHRHRSEIPVNKPSWIKPFSNGTRSLILFPCIFSYCQRPHCPCSRLPFYASRFSANLIVKSRCIPKWKWGEGRGESHVWFPPFLAVAFEFNKHQWAHI